MLQATFCRVQPQTPGGLRKPADVLKFPLLHLDDRKDWARWLERAGIRNIEVSQGVDLNRASMLIDAAVDGQGIALAAQPLLLGI
jgi:LysR family glycine cleavage system transcriptional activator